MRTSLRMKTPGRRSAAVSTAKRAGLIESISDVRPERSVGMAPHSADVANFQKAVFLSLTE